MRIGMSLTTSFPRCENSKAMMDNLIERVELMAELGFASLSLGDHHVTRNHYLQVLPTMSRMSAHSGDIQLILLFLLPFYVHTMPDVARKLLKYRVRQLDAARAKARANGYEGVMFPWESADTGEDVTPTWHKDFDGKVIEIHTMQQEHHITADVAYAVWHYFMATGEVFLMATGNPVRPPLELFVVQPQFVTENNGIDGFPDKSAFIKFGYGAHFQCIDGFPEWIMEYAEIKKLTFDDCRPIPTPILEKAFAWLSDRWDNGDNILISCTAGESRSVAIAIGLLSLKTELDFIGSCELVFQKMPSAYPHPQVLVS